MDNLIDDFTLTADVDTLENDFTAVEEFCLSIKYNNYQWSIILKTSNLTAGELRNFDHLQTLESISLLNDDWDDGAKAREENVIQRARALVKFMCAVGQGIYNIAPGPKGEILIDFRNDKRSLEILFYPNKEKFVKFSDEEPPQQGVFHPEELPLLSFLA